MLHTSHQSQNSQDTVFGGPAVSQTSPLRLRFASGSSLLPRRRGVPGDTAALKCTGAAARPRALGRAPVPTANREKLRPLSSPDPVLPHPLLRLGCIPRCPVAHSIHLWAPVVFLSSHPPSKTHPPGPVPETWLSGGWHRAPVSPPCPLSNLGSPQCSLCLLGEIQGPDPQASPRCGGDAGLRAETEQDPRRPSQEQSLPPQLLFVENL